jgi:hypothetical protein
MRFDENETIIFMHIPKTAGTTLQAIMRKQFFNINSTFGVT